MFFGDLPGDGQAQPAAALLGADKQIEELVADFFRHARTGIADGERRLPLEEALRLTTLDKVTLAEWRDQQLPDPPPSKSRYRRRDLQAEE